MDYAESPSRIQVKADSKIARISDLDNSKYRIIDNERCYAYALKTAAPDESGYTVTINMKYTVDDMNMSRPMLGYFTGNEYKNIDVSPNGSNVSVKVPSGVHDFIFSIYDLGTETVIYIVKEQVEIDKDTELNFDIADATERIRVENYSLNGELFQLPTVDYETGEIVKEGNCKMVSVTNFLTHAKSGICPMTYGNTPTENETSGFIVQKISDSWDFYTNKLSDNYMLSTVRVILDNDGNYNVVYLTNNGAESKTIKNSKDSYSWSVTDDFKLSPLSKESKLETKSGFSWFRYDLNGYLNGSDLGYIGFEMPKEGFPEYRVSSNSDELKIAVCPSVTDYTKEIVTEYEIDGEIYTHVSYEYGVTQGVPVGFEDEQITYLKNAYTPYNRYGFMEDRKVPFIGHPEFSFEKAYKKGFYGNSCPINVFEEVSMNYNGYKTLGLTSHSCQYIGRLGETRGSDAFTLGMSVKYNGKEITNDYRGLDEFVQKWNSESHENGEFDMTFTNTNVDVDGITGKNVTHITYDQRKDDCTAPVLQMLQFRNAKNDVVTDHFDFATDGVMELAVGDFEMRNPESFFDKYYVCKDVDVEAAVSAYDSNEWKPIAVKEVPSQFYMPGFGFFYRGSLSDAALDGWYDLKILLTDTSGNKQEQIISPAFKVGKDGGISDLTDENFNIYVSDGILHLGKPMSKIQIYDSFGVLKVSVNDSEGLLNIASLQKGIYIVKVEDYNGATSVGKISVK